MCQRALAGDFARRPDTEAGAWRPRRKTVLPSVVSCRRVSGDNNAVYPAEGTRGELSM